MVGGRFVRSQETTAKVRNLRRNPRATLCVFVEAFRGPWVQIDVSTLFRTQNLTGL